MPPRYEIRLAGAAGRIAASAFGGLDIVRDGDVTILRGELDQAALHGLLERVRVLNLDLLDVRRARSPRLPPASEDSGG